jgi:hypothetical protein
MPWVPGVERSEPPELVARLLAVILFLRIID